jgi:hypothetical protein
MMLTELRAQFPFGILLVTDDTSTEPIPKWSSDEQQVNLARSAMAIKIRHEADGAAMVRVWDGDQKVPDARDVATVFLKTPSRILRISSAAGETFIRVDVPTDEVRVRILASAARDTDEVHLVISPGSDGN